MRVAGLKAWNLGFRAMWGVGCGLYVLQDYDSEVYECCASLGESFLCQAVSTMYICIYVRYTYTCMCTYMYICVFITLMFAVFLSLDLTLSLSLFLSPSLPLSPSFRWGLGPRAGSDRNAPQTTKDTTLWGFRLKSYSGSGFGRPKV